MKKITKVIVSLIMTAMLLVSSVSVAGVFAEDGCDCGHTPMILVSGFGATTLVQVNEDGSEEIAFPFGVDQVTSALTDNIGAFSTEAPLEFVKSIVKQLVEPIRMNPDGTSYYNLRPVYETVEDTSYEGFVRNNAQKYIPYTGSEFLDMERIADRIGDDHVFNFMYDWRFSGDKIADMLDEYIQDVLEYTGHDKVDVYSLSQGSVAVAQYLYKYAHKGQVEDMVFDNPILEGSNFVSDLLAPADEVISIDLKSVLDLLSSIMHIEKSISDLLVVLDILPESEIGLDQVLDYAAKDLIYPIAKDSPAYLEMVIDSEYERVIADYFSNPGNEKLIEEAKLVRNGYMKDVAGTFRDAERYGIEISVISHTGIDLVTASDIISDGIVDMSTSCGAYCSPDGKPFPEDYEQLVTNGKNCISPDRMVDISCGYIPERTWIIDGLYHGMIEWAPNSLELIETLFYTDDIKDAWSSARFPQFMQSNDSNSDLYMVFASTNCLYEVKDGTGKLVIENVSKENSMLIKSIEISGAASTTSVTLPATLNPGEKLTVTLRTTAETFGNIRINYVESDNYLKDKVKEEAFTITSNYSGLLTDGSTGTVVQDNSVFAFVVRILLTILNMIKSLFGLA